LGNSYLPPYDVVVSQIFFGPAPLVRKLPDLSTGTVGAFQNSSTGEMELFNPEDRFDFVNNGMGSLASAIEALMYGIFHIILLKLLDLCFEIIAKLELQRCAVLAKCTLHLA
jgi:hypothetical protein